MPKECSVEKSRLIGIWISIGSEASTISFNRLFGGPKSEETAKTEKSLELINGLLEDFRGMLSVNVDDALVADLVGCKCAERVSDEWLLAIALCFSHQFVDSGVSNGLSKQDLCSKICHCLTLLPHDLIWKTKTIIDRMVEYGVLNEKRGEVKLSPLLHEFITGEAKEQETIPTKPTPQDVFNDYLEHIPKLTPMQMLNGLRKAGYVGQEGAARSVCLAVYRHFKKIERHHKYGIPLSEFTLSPHLLLSGSTGVGKTFLLKTLFDEVLGFKNVTYFDCSNCTKVGIVGESLQNSLYQLVCGSNGNTQIAQTGIVVLDEFDKICFRQDQERDSGRVSSTGVQQALLKLMEESKLDLGAFRPGKPSRPLMFNTGNVMFIALGAFPHHRPKWKKRSNPIGFYSVNGHSRVEKPCVSRVSSYPGMMREVYGRFSQVLDFQPLNLESMTAIATQVLNQVGKELESENVELVIESGVAAKLALQAMKLKTGARGIRRSLNDMIQNNLFDAYSRKGESTVVNLFVSESGVGCKLESGPTLVSTVNLEKIEGVCEELEISQG